MESMDISSDQAKRPQFKVTSLVTWWFRLTSKTKPALALHPMTEYGKKKSHTVFLDVQKKKAALPKMISYWFSHYIFVIVR